MRHLVSAFLILVPALSVGTMDLPDTISIVQRPEAKDVRPGGNVGIRVGGAIKEVSVLPSNEAAFLLLIQAKDDSWHVVTQAPTDGTGLVLFIAFTDTKGKLYQVRQQVTATGPVPPPPGPDPPPNPPQPPTPLTGLAKISYDGAMKVDAAHRGKAKALADAQRQAANMAVALSDPGAILKGWRECNNEAVDKTAWATWAADVSKALEDGYKAGTIRTGTQFSQSFQEFAQGLEAVR